MKKYSTILIAVIVLFGVLGFIIAYPKLKSPSPTDIVPVDTTADTGSSTTTPSVPVTPPEAVRTYKDPAGAFSIDLPISYSSDASYKYYGISPTKPISGTKFQISAALAKGTNLSTDSYISVEHLPTSGACDAQRFLADKVSGKILTEGGISYSVASTGNAGAGNRYEETVYATQTGGICFGIRYYIHYTAIENYPAGSISSFDKQALLEKFDTIRRSFAAGK